jgi:ubiquinone/menaquinone biosynthesis C-methylase UbiE/DNA-binding transcriptional ArsR family regulator
MKSLMGTIFKAMADPTRQRLLEVLSRQELSVSELVEVLGLPQSTVSRHLKVLREAGLVVDRRVGAAVLHAAGGAASWPVGQDKPSDGHPAVELRERLLDWAVHEPLDGPTRERISRIIRRRQAASDDFFERIGTRWDQLRCEAFGEAFHLEALAALLPAEWIVADIGSGTGYLLPDLAARFRRVIAVEPAGAMLEAARSRPELKAIDNIEFRDGSLVRLPLVPGEVDLAIASLVLHHVPEPPGALKELRRVIRDGGHLLIIEQREHDNAAFHERMGDHWRGFAPSRLQAWAKTAGFADIRVSPLAHARPAGRHTGEVPGLYVLTGRAVAR